MIHRIKTAAINYFSLLNMDKAGIGMMQRRMESRQESRDTSLWVHLLLMLATIITTLYAGILMFAETQDIPREIIRSGIPYSASILVILLSHEMGHYLTARYFGIRASLPYFIPFPSIVGTMGAVIKIKSPIQNRRALLYVGAMGPLAGFIMSLIAAVIGIYLSEIKPLPAALSAESPIPIFGNSLLFLSITKAIHGTIPAGYDMYLSPLAWASWVGFLVTSLNLMPLGQLDGSHILYALIGRKQVYAGWLVFFGLVILSFIWYGWILWIIIALAILMIAHPPVPDIVPLKSWERAIGWSCVIIFIITFMPIPVDFIEAAEKNSRVYPITCEKCSNNLEPSGLIMHNKQLLLVSDKSTASVIYTINRKDSQYAAREFRRFRHPATGPGAHGAYPLDLEGISALGTDLFVLDEQNRGIYAINDKGQACIVPHDISAYNAKFSLHFSGDSTLAFEGIAIDKKNNRFYIANEIERAIIYQLRYDGKALTTESHIDLAALPGCNDSDISDLYSENGFVYVLNRNHNRIIKLDPGKKMIADELSFKGSMENLYSSKDRRGFAEGLCMDDDTIFIILDSDGRKLNGRNDGEHGALLTMPRPRGF